MVHCLWMKSFDFTFIYLFMYSLYDFDKNWFIHRLYSLLWVVDNSFLLISFLLTTSHLKLKCWNRELLLNFRSSTFLNDGNLGDNHVLEAIVNMKDPKGSDKAAIASYIKVFLLHSWFWTLNIKRNKLSLQNLVPKKTTSVPAFVMASLLMDYFIWRLSRKEILFALTVTNNFLFAFIRWLCFSVPK